MSTATILTVLRSGGAYTPEYVQRLARGVRRFAPAAEFVCLSDVPVPGVTTEPLTWDLPGWWAKMSAWADPRPGLNILLDLDTVIVGDLTPLLEYPGNLAILRDFNLREHREVPGLPAIGSAVVLWRGDAMRPVFDAFASGPERAIAEHPKRMDHFIRRWLPDCDYVQDVLPGVVACARQGFRGFRDGPPKNARVLCTWGSPRIHELPPAHWYRQAWEAA